MLKRVKFHKSLFWVPILAAGGPYWVPISQIFGSLYQSMEVPISFGDSAIHRTLHEGFRWCYSQERSIIIDIPINTVQKKISPFALLPHMYMGPHWSLFSFQGPHFPLFRLKKVKPGPWGYCTYDLLGDPFPLGTSFRFWVPLFSISK